MTTADSSAAGLIRQLSETWAATIEVCRRLTPAQWALPTSCPGWSVKDQVVHLIGTESMLAGRPTPDAPSVPARHVRNDIGRFNEAWVSAHRDVGGPEVLDELITITGERLEALRAMTEQEWDAACWTPVGEASYRRFMQIRVFDCWVHEMDVKDALDPPVAPSDGAAAQQAVDEVERALGLLIGKRAAAPDGSRVSLLLTGPVEREIHVAVEGRATVVDRLDRPPTVTLRLGSLTLLRLACGRVEPAAELRRGSVAIEGDYQLGEGVVAHLAFTV